MPSHDEIMDGMVDALAELTTEPGVPLTSTKYVHKLGRYAGRLDTTEETLQRGTAGRTPAVIIGYEGERNRYTTIGRRTARVEATFAAVCISDAARERDERKTIYRVVEDVRRLLSSRALGLSMAPLRYIGDQVVRDDEKMLAISARFLARYRVDYTKTDGDYPEMTEVQGQIFNSATSDSDDPDVKSEVFIDLSNDEDEE